MNSDQFFSDAWNGEESVTPRRNEESEITDVKADVIEAIDEFLHDELPSTAHGVGKATEHALYSVADVIDDDISVRGPEKSIAQGMVITYEVFTDSTVVINNEARHVETQSLHTLSHSKVQEAEEEREFKNQDPTVEERIEKAAMKSLCGCIASTDDIKHQVFESVSTVVDIRDIDTLIRSPSTTMGQDGRKVYSYPVRVKGCGDTDGSVTYFDFKLHVDINSEPLSDSDPLSG